MFPPVELNELRAMAALVERKLQAYAVGSSVRPLVDGAAARWISLGRSQLQHQRSDGCRQAATMYPGLTHIGCEGAARKVVEIESRIAPLPRRASPRRRIR